MLNVNIDKLNDCWTEQKKFLKDGLLAGDIWDRSTGLSLAGVNSNPELVALFNGVTDNLIDALDGAGFPSLNRYYLLSLQDDKLVIMICHGTDMMQGMLLDAQRVNMGLLFTVAIPKALAKVGEARA